MAIRKINQAYEDEKEYNPDDPLKTVVQWYQDISEHCHVSTITCDTMEEAFIMFKAQNTTGLDLDGSDIVKVLLQEKTNMFGMANEFLETWSSIDSDFGEKPTNIGYMLGDYWKSRKGVDYL